MSKVIAHNLPTLLNSSSSTLSSTLRRTATATASSTSSTSTRNFSSTTLSLSGSNKWSKIRHKKAAQDALKGNAYGALSREILSCIKASPLPKDLASLPEHNSRLSYLLRKAKDLDIPKEKIEVTLQKARSTGNTGEETAIYEVLGSPSSSSPTSSSGGGQPIALVIECTTNSTSRTIAKLKESLNKMHNGWRLGNTGHLFDKVGTIWLALKEDEAGENFDKVFEGAVENGAEDVRWLEDEEWEGEESLEEVREKGERVLEILCPPSSLRSLSLFLTTPPLNYSVLLSEQRLIPSGPVIRISSEPESETSEDSEGNDDSQVGGYVNEDFVERLDKLAELLEEAADCQRIWSNLEGWSWPR